MLLNNRFFSVKSSIHKSNTFSEILENNQRLVNQMTSVTYGWAIRKPYKNFRLESLFKKGIKFSMADTDYIISRINSCSDYKSAKELVDRVRFYEGYLSRAYTMVFFLETQTKLDELKVLADVKAAKRSVHYKS